jgi:predicted Zn-dependent protease
LDSHYYPAHFEKGNCQLLFNQAGAAAESFEAALGQSPNNSQIWMTYGYTLLRLGKTRASVGALRRSLDLKESDKAHYYMALALIQLGKRQEGITHAKRAYKLNPKNADAKSLASRAQ